MRTIFFGAVLVPLSVIFHPSQPAMVTWAYASFAVWAAYFGFAVSQFVNGNRALVALKGVVALVLAQIAAQGTVSLVATLWFR
jgi:hypothetical protein